MTVTKTKPSDKFTVEILEEWYIETEEEEGALLKQVIAKIKFYDDEYKVFATSKRELAHKVGLILIGVT